MKTRKQLARKLQAISVKLASDAFEECKANIHQINISYAQDLIVTLKEAVQLLDFSECKTKERARDLIFATVLTVRTYSNEHSQGILAFDLYRYERLLGLEDNAIRDELLHLGLKAYKLSITNKTWDQTQRKWVPNENT